MYRFAPMIVVLFTLPALAADLVNEAPPEPPKAAVAGERGIWGAIGYSTVDQKSGIFWGADTREEADTTALRYCQNAGGTNCETVVIYRNHRHWNDDDGSGFPYNYCASLAIEPSGTRWGVASAISKTEAKSKALNQCGDGCVVKELGCT